jgi:hypothetical protein
LDSLSCLKSSILFSFDHMWANSILSDPNHASHPHLVSWALWGSPGSLANPSHHHQPTHRPSNPSSLFRTLYLPSLQRRFRFFILSSNGWLHLSAHPLSCPHERGAS